MPSPCSFTTDDFEDYIEAQVVMRLCRALIGDPYACKGLIADTQARIRKFMKDRNITPRGMFFLYAGLLGYGYDATFNAYKEIEEGLYSSDDIGTHYVHR